MHIRWMVASAILGIITALLMVALILATAYWPGYWMISAATGAILTGIFSAAALVIGHHDDRQYRAGMDLVIGHVRQIMAEAQQPQG